MNLAILSEDGQPFETLVFRNVRGGRFFYAPSRVVVVASADAPLGSGIVTWRLTVPPGWSVSPHRHLVLPGDRAARWLVIPRGCPREFDQRILVTLESGNRQRVAAERRLGLELVGESTFVPLRHRLPWANRASDFGPMEPDTRHFRETFRLALFPEQFRRGLYGEVVRLSADPGRAPGGLCTGMARAALARSLGTLQAEGQTLRDQVIVLHGRQLSDRALLAGAFWFFSPSPRRAFQRFVRDLLQRGWSDLCFDVNVPKPWRRDVVSALLGQGHTVVPYAFRQSEPKSAQVLVWDPNRPDAAGETVISFDLARNRYRYEPLVEYDDCVTIVAVRQRAYQQGRTALLSSLASLILFSPAARRVMIGLAVSIAASTGLFRIARRWKEGEKPLRTSGWRAVG
jgi:hypothetical protein